MSASLMPTFRRIKAVVCFVLFFAVSAVFAEEGLTATASSAASTIEIGKLTIDGKVSDNLVAKALRRNIHRITECADQGVPSEGTIIIEYNILNDGAVSNCKVKTATLSDTSVTGCIKKVIMDIRHPVPLDGQTVTVSLPLRFILTLKF